jgi:hypothetical protein
MKFILAGLLVALFAQPCRADEWVRIDHPATQANGANSEIYIDRKSVARDGDWLTFDRIIVSLESRTYRPAMHGLRVSFDCEWETARYDARPSQAGPASPSPPATQRESFNPEVTGIAAPLCSGMTSGGDVLATEAAMLDDAARRLGFADWATASSLPPAPVVIRQVSPGPASKPLPDQEFGVAFPATDNRATILLRDSLKRDNRLVSGASIWVANVGVKPQPSDFQLRQYSRRAFMADCENGTIALETVATGPSAFTGEPLTRPPNAPQAKTKPGSASARLWAAVCTDAPVQRLVTAAEFFAYVDAPDEDPTFRARRSVRYGHDQVRWLQTPSREDLADSLEQSGIKLADLKWTSIWCIVTRDYKLVDCKIATNSRYYEELDKAHLGFADRYVPVRTTIDGQDIAGRTVEASIEWRPDGARLKPLTYKQSDLAWERAPPEADIVRAKVVNRPAEVALRCTITPTYDLSDCSAPSLTVSMNGISVIYHDLVTDGPEKTAERTQLAKAVRERVLPLLQTFKPPRTTPHGEDTAGQYVDMTFVWK